MCLNVKSVIDLPGDSSPDAIEWGGGGRDFYLPGKVYHQKTYLISIAVDCFCCVGHGTVTVVSSSMATISLVGSVGFWAAIIAITC